MGKGGGGGGPQQVTQTTSNLPEYARPYFENIMQRAQAESYRGYTPYEAERLAGFTPEQMQTQQETMGLRTPGEFGAGSQFAAAGGLGSLGLGAQAAGAGQRYMGMATDPNQMQAFMSPYQQAVTDVQKQAATREAQIAQMQADLAAPRQGSYGGARQALMQAERERGLLDRLNQIQAQGSQSAFEQAQKAQQFGSELGLRGLQTGVTGAGQAAQAGQALGQIGTAQQQADLARLQAQEQFGALAQQQRQQALDLAYQDFITQQQYPYKQLGFMSDLLRGSANLAATGGKTIYEAPQSQTQQLLQLGLGGLGMYKAFG